MKEFDVVIVGGGPAGMMAAIKAAGNGARIALLERGPKLGRKLQLTGKGRCNLTTAKSTREIVAAFDQTSNGQFLWNALNQFSNQDLISFFEERGLKLKTERGDRVFPADDRAESVVAVLERVLKELNVTVHIGARVKSIAKDGDRFAINTSRGKYSAAVLAVATGGLSYPKTGSTGNGYRFAESLGHRINPLRPSLVSLESPDPAIRRLKGLSLKNVELRITSGGKAIAKEFGEMLFTHFGISGPIVLEVSRYLGREPVDLQAHIDLKPALSKEQLDQRVIREIDASSRQHFKNLLKELLPMRLVSPVSDAAGIREHESVSQISREQRQKLVEVLKDFHFKLSGTRSIDEAVITAGGVDLDEIDPQTMESKIVPRLFFAGEILDLDGPTGGYNLQMCWTTGAVAGRVAAVLASL